MVTYTEWSNAGRDGVDSVVLYGEKFLDHNGLHVLNDFIESHGKTVVFVSDYHQKCAELLNKIRLADEVVLFAVGDIPALLDGCSEEDLLIGAAEKDFVPGSRIAGNYPGKIKFYSPAASSYVNILPENVKGFVSDLFRRYSFSTVLSMLEKFRELKILVVGETIIDEYIFTSAMNKSNKEPIIASQYRYEEKYAGGVLAVANHLANFSDNVKLITRIGERDSHEEFIKEHLNDSIAATFLVREDSPTIRKQRIVETHLARKMFEVYYINNTRVSEKNNREFEEELLRQLAGADLVILTDYGHGLFTDTAISIIEENAKFLAVNTQTNAGNKGFNLISKYQRADFIAIDHPEAQLECRNKEVPVEELIYQIADNTNCSRVTVTMGKQGNFYLCEGRLYTVPMLSVKAVDTTGAGDAFFSLASCAAVCGLDPDITGFIGNIAGAEACMIIGNNESINKNGMIEHMRNIADLAGVEYE